MDGWLGSVSQPASQSSQLVSQSIWQLGKTGQAQGKGVPAEEWPGKGHLTQMPRLCYLHFVLYNVHNLMFVYLSNVYIRVHRYLASSLGTCSSVSPGQPWK